LPTSQLQNLREFELEGNQENSEWEKMTAEHQVLIIGGGVVGLSASIALSYHGVESLIVERRPGTSIHPRARSVNARTMELFRRFGIDQQVREAGASISASAGIYTGHSLREIIEPKPRRKAPFQLPFKGLFESMGPTAGTFVTQDQLEPVLVQAVQDGEGAIQFNQECTSVTQDEKGVTATIKARDTGVERTVRAKYLIVADGAASRLRRQLNVPTTGQGAMGHLLNVLFKADLKSLVDRREFSLCVIERPEVCGLLTSINNSDRWVFHVVYDPAKGEKPADFPNDRCEELVRLALGLPEIKVEVESVLPWEPSARVVENMRVGNRIFLAGDAAHQFPPWGGMGANTGIVDAYNLAWKLAMVLKGNTGTALLDTYDEERRPVALAAADASAAGADERGLISVQLNWSVIRGWMKKLPLISGHGYGYASQVICHENTTPLGGLTWRPWTMPSLFACIDGRPGRRVPHIWLERDGKRISTLDVSGRSFVLLTGADGQSWMEAAKKVSEKLGIEVDGFQVGPQGNLVAPKGIFESAAGIYPDGAILIRPDDFVVWRQRRQRGDLALQLEQAMTQALSLH
jgi:putative polyketide hydroxylase